MGTFVQRCVCDKIFINIRSVLRGDMSQIVDKMLYLQCLEVFKNH